MDNLDFLSNAESKQRENIIADLNSAFLQRSQSYTEFDDMTYLQWYIANKKASTGYIRPKLNKQEIRTVTGTTREKCNTIVTAMLKYNFDFNMEAYDESDYPQQDLADGISSLVRKSRNLEIPSYEAKRALIYNEFVAQGNVFILEQNVQEEIIRKKMDEKPFDDVFKAKWKESKELVNRCESTLIPGLNVYLGDIRQYHMQKQPFIGIRREIHESVAESTYEHTKRWAEAKKWHNTHVLNDKGGSEYNNWLMLTPMKKYKEEIRYYNLFTNTYQIMVDGIPMLPDEFPLEYLNGVLAYPLIKWNLEPISEYFAYCRGIATKNKFNQAMIDEMFRVIMEKFRLSTKPPMSNMTGKMLNKSIFYPSTIHQGIDATKLTPILNTPAISGPEFQVFNLVKETIDESSVTPSLAGTAEGGRQTASQFQQLAALALQKLGMVMSGAIHGEEEMVWLRTYNILRNWTSPVDSKLEEVEGQIKKEDSYRQESLSTQFSDGGRGTHIIRMMKDNLPTAHQTKAEEDLLTSRKGVDVRITNLGVDELSTMKYKFKVNVTTIDKTHTEIKAALFEESLLKAKQIWPNSVNDEYAQDRWAVYQGIDPKKLFVPNSSGVTGALVAKNGAIQQGFAAAGGALQLPPPGGQQAGAQTTPGAKTQTARMLPQVKQQMKSSVTRQLMKK